MKINDQYIKATLKRRSPLSHKGDFGKLLIFSGSPGMAGAAVLNGKAALKGGAGLVRYLLPDFQNPLFFILQCSVPEATCVEMKAQLSLTEYSAIISGSGLGKYLEAKKILSYIICAYTGTLILDADALNMIAEDESLTDFVRNSKAKIILTPHIGEARRLLHTTARIADETSRRQAAWQLSEQYHCICVLKGAGTLIADAESGQIDQNSSGNPGMATAGSGDVLAGLIASLAAQGYAPLDAARLGVFLHGKAGDLAAQKLSEMGVCASDLADHIPYALKLYYPDKENGDLRS